jgi:hypothetical protein
MTTPTRFTPAQLATLFPDSSASYAAPPILRQRGPASFEGAEPAAIAHYLVNNGYDLEPAHSAHEWARLWFRGALVVIYHSGTALIQGKPEPSLALLSGLCEGGQQ